MARGLSLHIGVNAIDPGKFVNGHFQRLKSAVADAHAMAQLARRNGFETMPVLADGSATFAKVEGALRAAADRTGAGDVFLLTFSGHGTQLPTGNPAEYGCDEALVLRDGLMKDDYADVLLRLFPSDCFIIFVCDCCHSCTMYEYLFSSGQHRPVLPPRPHPTRRGLRARFLEPGNAKQHVLANYKLYDERDRRFAQERREQLRANVAMLSACQDNDSAYESGGSGCFTRALLYALEYCGPNGGRFIGSYQDLMGEVAHQGLMKQIPCYTPLGPNTMHQFFQGPPFTLFKGKP